MRVTLLGTGTSTGVPMIGCTCKTCLSTDPRDTRLRVSALLQTDETTLLIDTSADFRQQMLTHKVKWVDAIVYTHQHYDHISGFDDLRAFQFLYRKAPMCYATEETFEVIKQTFAYAFSGKPAGGQRGGGIPEVPFTMIDSKPFKVRELDIVPIPIAHGNLHTLGFRVGGFAYLTDCSQIPQSSVELLQGVEVLVLDGLRYKEHPTHFSVEQAIEQAHRINPGITYLTHMNHDLMYSEANPKLPKEVQLAYDGLSFEVNL